VSAGIMADSSSLRPTAYRALFLGLLTAVGGLLFFAWLADQVLKGGTRRFDYAVRELLHQQANPALTAAMRAASFVGSPVFLIPLGFLVVVLYVRQGRPVTARLFVITVLGGELLDQILKLVFQRTRPVAFFGLAEPKGYSFPSGHALTACAFYGVLAAFAAARTESRARRWIYWIASGLLVAVIGISRIYLGVHYPSDVLGGYTAALVWILSVASVRRWIRRQRTISRP
jgi:undecaprenyl-diphosphatase